MSRSLKLSWIPSMIVVVGLMVFSSCKDDEKPKSKMSFAETEIEALEDDGKIQVKINFDRAVAENVVLSYTLGGTATEFKAQTGGDYEISPAGGTITIAPGATEAIIEITLLPDQSFEYDDAAGVSYETVILTLTSVVSGPAEIVAGEGTQATLYIYEDDMLVFLNWEGTDVDMDLLVWLDDPNDNPDQGLLFVSPAQVGGGVTEGTESPEAVLLLSQLIDTDYGFSYVYYDGTADPLNFSVDFLNFGGMLNGGEGQLSFDGTYQLDNINKWDEEGAPAPAIAQTVTKSGRNYTNLTDITIPDTGSRIRTMFGNFGNANKVELRKHPGVQKITLTRDLVEKLRRR